MPVNAKLESALAALPTMKPLALALALILAGCGAVSPSPKPATIAPCEADFRNDSNIPTGSPDVPYKPTWSQQEATLWTLWRAAQVDLSTQPVCYLDGHCISPLPEAADEQPHCVRVVSVPAEPGIGFACAGQMVGGCVVDGVVYTASYNTWYSSYEISNAILCRYSRCAGR